MERERRRVDKQIEINFSMLNLPDVATFWSLIAPVEFHAFVAKAAGYSGVEYFPVRVPASFQGFRGPISRYGLEAIASAHQSWRSERSLTEVRKHPNPKLAALAFLTLPERVESLKILKRLQAQLGEDLPVVVFAGKEELQSPIFGQLKNKLIEPTPELFEKLNASSVEDFMTKIRNMGIDKVCLDLVNIRQRARSGLAAQKPWQELVVGLLPYTGEIHLGAGRSDVPLDFDSTEELRDLYFGERKTDIIPLLETISEQWQGPITTEIPAGAVARVLGKRILAPWMLIRAHKTIVGNISDILAA